MSRPTADGSVFHAIADPTRRAVLALLKSDEKSAGELVAHTGASNSLVSQHLSVLLNAGLVHQRKEGKHRYYRLEPKPLEEVRDFVEEFSRFWDQKLDSLRRYLEEME